MNLINRTLVDNFKSKYPKQDAIRDIGKQHFFNVGTITSPTEFADIGN